MSTLAAAESTGRPRDAVASAARHAELDPVGTRRRELIWQDPLASLGRVQDLSGLEQMRAVMNSEVPPPPIAVLMNMAPVELEEGRVVFRGQPSEEHYNPIGAVHGGYAATLLDTALGCAVQTKLPAGRMYTTLTLETKMVRPISRDTGPVLAEGAALYVGRRQATGEARITAESSGKLLAHGTTTCMVFELP